MVMRNSLNVRQAASDDVNEDRVIGCYASTAIYKGGYGSAFVDMERYFKMEKGNYKIVSHDSDFVEPYTCMGYAHRDCLQCRLGCAPKYLQDYFQRVRL